MVVSFLFSSSDSIYFSQGVYYCVCYPRTTATACSNLPEGIDPTPLRSATKYTKLLTGWARSELETRYSSSLVSLQFKVDFCLKSFIVYPTCRRRGFINRMGTIWFEGSGYVTNSP